MDAEIEARTGIVHCDCAASLFVASMVDEDLGWIFEEQAAVAATPLDLLDDVPEAVLFLFVAVRCQSAWI